MNTIIILFALIAFFVAVGIIVLALIANWSLFKKAGRQGWESIVPFYSTWVLVEICGLNWWWFLLVMATNIVSFISADLATVASLVSIFAGFNCYYNLAKKFRKSDSVAVLAGIFSGIFIFIFAFSKNEIYYDEEMVSSNGVFPGDPKETTGTTNVDNSSEFGKAEMQIRVCTGCGCKIEDNHKFCSVCGKEQLVQAEKSEQNEQ